MLSNGEKDPKLMEASHWLDRRFGYANKDVKEILKEQTQRRIIKSHLPLDTLPYSPTVKYVFVARDGRDVALSLFNHYNDYTDKILSLINETPGRIGIYFFYFLLFTFFTFFTFYFFSCFFFTGPELPKCNKTEAQFCKDFIEKDGDPFWSFCNKKKIQKNKKIK